jgi:SMODS-associating 2TM, beta-strand rich effector domain
MMKQERYLKAVIYATVGLWTILLWLNHQAIEAAWFKPLSTVTTAVLAGALLFDVWAWKIPLINKWFVKRPVIEGTWSTTIASNWTDPASGQGIPPIQAYMVVRQTLSTLSMRLLTKESSSELVGTEIVCSVDGLFCVSGVYRNEPQFEFRHRSQIHYGGIWLEISTDAEQKTIRGHYWTDRNTAGSISMRGHLPNKFQSFQGAEAAFGKLSRKKL